VPNTVVAPTPTTGQRARCRRGASPAAFPPPSDYRVRIARARDRLTAPGGSLRKVVLAVHCSWLLTLRWTHASSCAGFVAADPAAYGYLVDLTAAGDDYAGAPWWSQSGAVGRAFWRPGVMCNRSPVGRTRCGPGTGRR